MAPLQLREGDKVSFRVEALNQDAIDGPQKGSSSVHTLKVFSAAEHHKEGLQRAQALWERLVALLGDRLEEPAPAKPGAAPPAQDALHATENVLHANDSLAELQARDARALQLVAELRDAGALLAKDKLAPRALGRALKYVASGLSPLVQRTVIARAPLTRPAGFQPGTLKLLARALELEAREEEKDVLYLDDLLDQARIDDLQDLQRELKRSREELKKLAEKLRAAPDEATKKQVLAEVQRLRERVQELMQRMAQMAKGINDEHLNQEARQSVEKEQDSDVAALRGAEEDAGRRRRRGAQRAGQIIEEPGVARGGIVEDGRAARRREVCRRGQAAAQGRGEVVGAQGARAGAGEADRTAAQGAAHAGAEAVRAARRKAAGAEARGEGRRGEEAGRQDRSARGRQPGARGDARRRAGAGGRFCSGPCRRAIIKRRSSRPPRPSAPPR